MSYISYGYVGQFFVFCCILLFVKIFFYLHCYQRQILKLSFCIMKEINKRRSGNEFKRINRENSGSCYSHVYRKLVQLSGCSLALRVCY